MLEVKPVPAFADNYIWLIINSDNRRVALVDPGDAAPVLEVIRAERLIPEAILATHHHGDHVGGVEGILEQYPVPVIGPAREAIPGKTRAVQEGNMVELGGLGVRFEVLDVPGHTAGHIAFHGHGMAFVGDTLFMAGCGRLFEGTPAQMHGSLCKLAALPDDTRIYCAHEYTLANLGFAAAVEPGNPDIQERIAASVSLRAENLPTVPATLALEKRTNPFLRVQVRTVREAASAYSGRALETGSEIFGAVRRWKDSY